MTSYDSSERLARSRQQADPSHWFIKLLALVILLLCVAVGMVGLILPIIPGLLFLALAAMIAARFFPALDARLRKSRLCAAYLEKADNFSHLSIQGKLRLACWMTLKVVFDAFVLLLAGLGRLLNWLRKDSV